MTDNAVSTDPRVNDFRITLKRTQGKWEAEITGMPVPRDIHQAQTFLSRYYKSQRRKIAESFNRTRKQRDELMAEVKEAKRELTHLKGATNARTDKQSDS